MIKENQVLQWKENGRLKIDRNKSNSWSVLNNQNNDLLFFTARLNSANKSQIGIIL